MRSDEISHKATHLWMGLLNNGHEFHLPFMRYRPSKRSCDFWRTIASKVKHHRWLFKQSKILEKPWNGISQKAKRMCGNWISEFRNIIFRVLTLTATIGRCSFENFQIWPSANCWERKKNENNKRRCLDFVFKQLILFSFKSQMIHLRVCLGGFWRHKLPSIFGL